MEHRVFVRSAAALVCAIALTACDNRDAVAPQIAALAVIVNTPIPGAGAVIVSGPAGYSRTMVHTDTLRGIPTGQYAIRAANAASSDSLVSTVLTGLVVGSPVALQTGQMATVTSTYSARGGSGALWVGKWGSVNLAEGFTSSQLAAAATASPADTIGALATPRTILGAAFDSAGNMWATDYQNQQILEFTPAQLASGVSTPAVVVSTSKMPAGMAFDAHGNLWVNFLDADFALEYTASQIAGWSGSLSDPTPAQQIAIPNGPVGMAFDAGGNLWVATFGAQTIYKFTATALAAGGTVVPADSLVSSFLQYGSGLAFDRAGNLWEGTEWGYIVSYTAAQLADTARGEPAFAQQGQYSRFDGIAFDNAGNLWATTESPDVAMYSPAQLASGDLTSAARTLTTASGEQTFALAFNSNDSMHPVASTNSVAQRAPRVSASRRVSSPSLHRHDGSRPGTVRRW